MEDRIINRCPFGHGACTYIEPLCDPTDPEDREKFGKGYGCTAAGNEIRESEIWYDDDTDVSCVHLTDGECTCTMYLSEYAIWNHKCAYGCGGNKCVPVKHEI